MHTRLFAVRPDQPSSSAQQLSLVSDRFNGNADSNMQRTTRAHYGSDHQCPVCLNEPRYPVETNCGHLFCGSLQQKSLSNSVKTISRQLRFHKITRMPGSCVFNALWLTRQEYSTWIAVSDSRTKARCRLCLKDFDIGKMGESALKSHMAGKKHSEIMKAQVNPKITDLLSTSSSRQGPGRTSKEILTDQAENNTIAPFIASSQCLDAELKWSLKCVENHYSYNSCKDISNLFQDMFPDNSPARREDYLKVSEIGKLPKKFCRTRWLENAAAAERAIEIWNDLVLYVNNVENNKVPTPKSQCVITYWRHGNWMGAIHCPVCRQLVTALLQCFTNNSDLSSTERIRLLEEINDYNRHYSGEPRPWLDYLWDLPTLLRHAGSEFFSVGGIMYMFRLRIFLCFIAAVMYLISPLDMIPEAVFGILGLLDDMFVVLLLAIYVTVIYRRFLAARWQNQ
ncbi:unnamed protein product [Larinioides sclopetarius]